MKKIFIYYTCFEHELSPCALQKYLFSLPPEQQHRNAQYHRWQDRQAHLFGRLLLLAGWNHLDKRNPLECMQYDSWMRPFIPGNIDFNISHAGNYVVCVLGESVRLGVDIELCHDIGFNDYSSTMTERQWADIVGSADPSRTFFRYWTMKEAVIKADGRGLTIPLDTIEFNDRGDIVQAGHLFLHELGINPRYQTWLACNIMEIEIVPVEIVF